MRKSDIEALITSQMTSSGYRRSYVAHVYYGDHPMDANFTFESSPAGFVTSIGNVTGSSVNAMNVNHGSIPFRHRVFVQKYS
jgi:hypothetical protein